MKIHATYTYRGVAVHHAHMDCMHKQKKGDTSVLYLEKFRPHYIYQYGVYRVCYSPIHSFMPCIYRINIWREIFPL